MGEQDREQPLPATRAELMERAEAAWTALDAALIDLDPHQLGATPSGGGWSIQDHLAHLTVWVQSAVAILAGTSRAAAMGVSDAVWASHDEDDVNAAIADAWHGRTALDVLTALRTAQAELRERVSALEDDDLARPYSAFQPDAPAVTDPVVGWLAGNTYEHVAMHLPAIRAIRAQVT